MPAPHLRAGGRARRACDVLALALLGWFAIAAWAIASDVPAPLLQQVTVIAPRPPTPAQLAGESVPNFILHHATAPVALGGQLTRWRVGICPKTRGLSSGFNAFVTARIRAVASSVGAPVKSEANCKVNLQILFTTEPQTAIDEIANASPMLIGNHYESQLRAMQAVHHPIQGWYVTATSGAYGSRVLDDTARLNIIWGTDIGHVVGTVPHCLPGSHLQTECSNEIINVILIADSRKVAGYTIGSISDYLAVLALSMEQSPDRCDPLPSILDLMTPGCRNASKPSGVTAGDLAFLRALYQSDLSVVGALERSDIYAGMMRQFAKR